jgi:hypothetical protein
VAVLGAAAFRPGQPDGVVVAHRPHAYASEPGRLSHRADHRGQEVPGVPGWRPSPTGDYHELPRAVSAPVGVKGCDSLL